MDSTGIEIGAGAMGGAVVMKLLDFASRFIPYFNRNGKNVGELKETIRKDAVAIIEDALDHHGKECPLGTTIQLHEQRLDSGDTRFKELLEKIDGNHRQIIDILLDRK